MHIFYLAIHFTVLHNGCLLMNCVAGQSLIQDLLYKFLFPSSKLILESGQHPAEGTLSGFSPKLVVHFAHSVIQCPCLIVCKH